MFFIPKAVNVCRTNTLKSFLLTGLVVVVTVVVVVDDAVVDSVEFPPSLDSVELFSVCLFLLLLGDSSSSVRSPKDSKRIARTLAPAKPSPNKFSLLEKA